MCLSLDRDFFCIFQYKVHVLIKSDDAAFDSHILLFKQPNLNASFALQEAKNQIDGLGHNPLHSGSRHGCSALGWIYCLLAVRIT